MAHGPCMLSWCTLFGTTGPRMLVTTLHLSFKILMTQIHTVQLPRMASPNLAGWVLALNSHFVIDLPKGAWWVIDNKLFPVKYFWNWSVTVLTWPSSDANVSRRIVDIKIHWSLLPDNEVCSTSSTSCLTLAQYTGICGHSKPTPFHFVSHLVFRHDELPQHDSGLLYLS